MPRTEEKISKGRRAFHALTSVGIKKRGVNMSVCSKLFWSIVIPIVTYGCEIWVMKGDEVAELRKFQHYIGRRSPNHSSYSALGWLSIDRFIQIKKLLFMRTIAVMDDDDPIKRVLVARTHEFTQDLEKNRRNENDSPIFDLLDTSIRTGMYDTCMQMIMNGHYYSKEGWRKMVWECVWAKEDEDCITLYKQPHQNILLYRVTSKPYFLIWWLLSDLYPSKISMCENMARLVCDASRLKATDYRLKGKSHSNKICVKCDLGIIENIHHLVMQCSFYVDNRTEMYAELRARANDATHRIMDEPQHIFYYLMGQNPEGVSFEDMLDFWLVSGKHINGMYMRALVGRD